MNASELKYQVERAGTCKHFFTRTTMKFFGDTMRNYGVRRTTVKTYDGVSCDVWELYRRRAVKHGLRESTYFDVNTFERVHTPRVLRVTPEGSGRSLSH